MTQKGHVNSKWLQAWLTSEFPSAQVTCPSLGFQIGRVQLSNQRELQVLQSQLNISDLSWECLLQLCSFGENIFRVCLFLQQLEESVTHNDTFLCVNYSFWEFPDHVRFHWSKYKPSALVWTCVYSFSWLIWMCLHLHGYLSGWLHVALLRTVSQQNVFWWSCKPLHKNEQKFIPKGKCFFFFPKQVITIQGVHTETSLYVVYAITTALLICRVLWAGNAYCSIVCWRTATNLRAMMPP